MRIACPTANGRRTGSGIGAGGSAWAEGISTIDEIDEMAQTARTFLPERWFRRTGSAGHNSDASNSAI
jgi:hypothetical protein